MRNLNPEAMWWLFLAWTFACMLMGIGFLYAYRWLIYFFTTPECVPSAVHFERWGKKLWHNIDILMPTEKMVDEYLGATEAIRSTVLQSEPPHTQSDFQNERPPRFESTRPVPARDLESGLIRHWLFDSALSEEAKPAAARLSATGILVGLGYRRSASGDWIAPPKGRQFGAIEISARE